MVLLNQACKLMLFKSPIPISNYCQYILKSFQTRNVFSVKIDDFIAVLVSYGSSI